MLPDVLFNVVLNPPPVSNPYSVILPSAVGIVGVVIGGLITTATNFYLARRKERADEESKAEGRSREVVEACRIISIQIMSVSSSYSVLTTKKEYLHRDRFPTVLSSWSEYAPILAHETTDDEWLALSMLESVLRVNDFVLANATPGETVDQGHIDYVAHLQSMMKDCKKHLDNIRKRQADTLARP